MSLNVLLLILGLVCFVLAAFGVASPRVGLGWLGLAFWILAVILGGG